MYLLLPKAADPSMSCEFYLLFLFSTLADWQGRSLLFLEVIVPGSCSTSLRSRLASASRLSSNSLEISLLRRLPFLMRFYSSAGLMLGFSFSSCFIHWRISPIPACISGLDPTLLGLFGLLEPLRLPEYLLLLSPSSFLVLSFASSIGPNY